MALRDRLPLFAPLLVFAVLAVVFMSLSKRQLVGDYDPSELPSALLGKPVPEFSLPDLHDAERLHGHAAINGKGTLLNVWATWCVACRVEHPYLNTLRERGIRIIGVNYKDDRPAAIEWLQRLGDPYAFSVFDDRGDFGLALGVYGAPETYVVDEQGIVRYRHVGILDQRVWDRHIQPLGIQW